MKGLRREDSAAAMHCRAYSGAAMSVGIDTRGRTLNLRRPGSDMCVCSLDRVSKSAGEVALLDNEEIAEELSVASVRIEDVIESVASSDFIWVRQAGAAVRSCSDL